MPSARSQSSVALTLSVCLVLAGAGCGETPTEPAALTSRAQLKISTLPLLGGPSGTVTLKTNTCSCASKPLSVSLNVEKAGTIECGETRVFPAPAYPFTISVESPEVLPIRLSLEKPVTVGPGGGQISGPAVGIGCEGG